MMKQKLKKVGLLCLLVVVSYVSLILFNTSSKPIPEAPTEEQVTGGGEELPAGQMGEGFSEEELDALNEKAEALAQEAHYNSNVEQEGRVGMFKRTSYYDAPIGRLIAGNVHIDELIYAGASELNMRRGVATVTYQEQLDEHTVAIAGHRSKNPRQYLTGALYLKKGDEVTVQTFKEGTEEVASETVYVVSNMFTVTPSQVEVLEEEVERQERKLVLITCYNFNEATGLFDERYIVNAYAK